MLIIVDRKYKNGYQKSEVKALCNGKKETNGIKTEWYRRKSSKSPKQVKDLIPSENKLMC